MNINFTPEYQYNLETIFKGFEESIEYNWKDGVCTTFLEKIKTEYFEPIMKLAERLDRCKDEEQQIVQYCYCIKENSDESKPSDDSDNEQNSEKSHTQNNQDTAALFTTREDLKSDRLLMDLAKISKELLTDFCEQSGFSETGGFDMEVPSKSEEKVLVRTRVK